MAICSDLMTRNPVWCVSTDAVSSIARSMKQEDVGFLPVLNDRHSKKVIGVITDRDLVLNVVAEGRTPETTTIADVMTARPVTCRAGDPLERALTTLAQHQVRRLPIVGDDGELVGIIALADVALRVDDAAATVEITRKISKPTIVHPSMAVNR
jgi:CBS domain-containing protein